ncbi:universal stress protein [Nitrospinota bacterium]
MEIYDPKKILVPVDFSGLSKGVLRTGVEIGEIRDLEVTALHVAKEPTPRIQYGVYGEGLAPTFPASKFREDTRMKLESRLELMVKEVSAGPKVKPVVLWGEPTQEILRHAESGDFDLIVLGTHGHKGLSRFLLGSVAERVIRRAPCPVFVFREKVATKRLEQMTMEQAAMN